jgi:hypothetical protein
MAYFSRTPRRPGRHDSEGDHSTSEGENPGQKEGARCHGILAAYPRQAGRQRCLKG